VTVKSDNRSIWWWSIYRFRRFRGFSRFRVPEVHGRRVHQDLENPEPGEPLNPVNLVNPVNLAH
jgi:hypothetical protein